MKTPTSFTRADRRAIILLSVIAVVCVVGIIFFGTDNDSTSDSEVPKSEVQQSTDSEISTTQTTDSPLLTSYTFDPNTVDSSTLVSLGISPRRVHTFMRYRSAGAVFRKPDDIARCYSFSDEDIDRLLPLIHISSKYKHKGEYQRDKYPIEKKEDVSQQYSPSTSHPTSHSYSSNKFTTLTTVNINTADTSLLKRIPGVGDVIASMIVNLRERFGGFTSVSQLSQISQISPELMEWFKVEQNPELRKININTASFKTLVSHPYISRDQANAILHYIRHYGNIPNADTLLQTDIFTQDQLTQLLPYLQF